MRSTDQPQPMYDPWGRKPAPMPRRQRFVKSRAWLHTRTGRVVVCILALFVGIVMGVVGLLLYFIAITTPGQAIVTPVPSPGMDTLIGQVSPAYMAQVMQNNIQQNLPALGLLGTIDHVEVQLADSSHTQNNTVVVMITANYEVPVIGGRLMKMMVQLYAQNCQLMAKVMSVDVTGLPLPVPIVAFKAALEGQINQQLLIKTNDLPPGFDYCIDQVSSKPDGVYVRFEAKPM